MKPGVVGADGVAAALADVGVLMGLHEAELVSVDAVRTAHCEVAGQSNCGGTHLDRLFRMRSFARGGAISGATQL
jgi:hypothetical protein